MFFIRCEDAAIILTKRENFTLCESFEVVPGRGVGRESLMCSYPCSAVETPNEVFDDGGFRSELADFLSYPDSVYSDLSPPPAHPQCVTTLTGILQGVGLSADAPRITKHVRDYVGKLEANEGVPWRRSSLWLLTRVTIQMSVDRSPLGRAAYKRFLLFFICTLLGDRNNAGLSSDLLHLMSCKVLRRLSKLGSSPPHWLSEMALKTCAGLGEILDARWKQPNARPSPFRNPSQDELIRDTRLSLLNSREYIRNALANPVHESVSTPFHPTHRRRGTIGDFLSSSGSLFEEECRVNPDVALYDVERSVEQGIDDWLACVTNVNEACTQVGILLDKYVTMMTFKFGHVAEDDVSIELLTMIELYVALDKLVVKEIPMLADYSPEIPITSLEKLLLCNATSLHRLSCAYLYLSMRHSQARPEWSVLSANFTEDSFPVRYYDQSLHLQQLKVRIEEDATKKVTGGDDLVDGAEVFRSPLPSMPLPAKVVVFELQAPPCLRIWRSVTARALARFGCLDDNRKDVRTEETPIFKLVDVPELQPYFIGCQEPPLFVEFEVAYFYPEKSPGSQDSLTLGYVTRMGFDDPLRYPSAPGGKRIRYGFFCNDASKQYKRGTSHTSNNVLAAQASCPTDCTPDEFITFAHLRSGGSLQWLNILRGLRSRTLNLRHHDVHHLLTNATFQVGPLDLNTGTWTWHQELQDSCFCNGLLDELDSLFMEVGVRSIDGVMMKNISLLLTRMLASSPSEDVSERAIALLRGVRRKTFSWVQELLYDLVNAPTNKNRTNLLLNMAATCRSTFDIGSATLPGLVYSAEDVDTLLSCAMFIHTLGECMSHCLMSDL